MTGCRERASTHDGLDVLPVKLPLRREIEPMCAGCRATFAAMGADVIVVERRIEDIPVEAERRRIPRPAWLRNLTAREDGSWRVAS